MDVSFKFMTQFECLYKDSYREMALYSGRGSGKSFAVAEYLILLALTTKSRILCAREIQNSISDSVIKLLADTIDRKGLGQYFDVQKSSIYCKSGSEFIFKGIKHSIESIKSMTGINVCWIEEAQTISSESLGILLPTVFRNEGAKILYTYNPRYANDAVYKRFNGEETPPHSIVKQLDWRDNIYFDQAMKDEMEYNFKVDESLALHIWEGHLMPSGGNNSVLPLHHLKKCVDVHKTINYNPSAFTYLGLDIATSNGSGGDLSAIAISNGAILKHVHSFDLEMVKIPDEVDFYAKKYNAVRVYYDAIGVGHSMGALINHKHSDRTYTLTPHVGSSRANGFDVKINSNTTNGQFFRNLKAQSWWNLRVRMENTLRLIDGENINPDSCLFIDGSIPNLEKLLLELNQPVFKHDDGKLMVDKSPDGTESPNLGDAVTYAFANGIKNGLKFI